MSSVDIDVLIIGAGPAGLCLAVALAMLNVKAKIVDRRLPGELYGQADGIQPRTIEIWDTLGMGEALRRRGIPVNRMAMFNAKKSGEPGIEPTSQGPNIQASEARYPFEILAPIETIEGIMRERLLEFGVTIDYGTVPTSLNIANDGPEVEVKLARDVDRLTSSGEAKVNIQAEELVRAKYAVGCDGSRSWIREAAGVKMEGDAVEMQWGVIDFTPETNLPTYRAKTIIQSSCGALGYLPRPGNTARAYLALGSSQNLSKDLATRNEELKALIARILSPYTMVLKDITWSSTYKVAQRVANKFSVNRRIFLAGEACHTHSPDNGQGANASMTDSYNLAWKLAYVLRGWAAEALLDTYEEERRPYSQELIELDKMVVKLFNPQGHMMSAEEFGKSWNRHILFTSGLGVKYSSSIIQKPEDSGNEPLFRLGERFRHLGLVRQCDWDTCSTLDLLSYDGAYKIFFFPSNSLASMAGAVQRLEEALAKSERLGRVLKLYTIASIPKESYFVEQLPTLPDRFRLRDNFYVLATDSKANVSFDESSRSLVAVRPDGHVGFVGDLTTDGIEGLVAHLSSVLGI